MAPAKYKHKQRNVIHGWLDKLLGGDWTEQDEIEDQKWATLRDKAEKEDSDLIIRRGGVHLVPRQKYDARGMPIASGAQFPPAASTYSVADQVSADLPEARSRQSHAAAIAQSHLLQNSYMQPSLVGSRSNTYHGGSRLSHGQNNPSMTPVSGPILTNQPSSSYQPNAHRSRNAASNLPLPTGSISLEPARHNNGSRQGQEVYATRSVPGISGTSGFIHGKIMPFNQQMSSNHQSSFQSMESGETHKPIQSRHQSYNPFPRQPLIESRSAQSISNTQASEHQSKELSNPRTQTQPTNSYEPSEYSMSVATSKAQVGNMQRTYLEGMVAMAPSKLRVEEGDDASSIALSVWSMSIATSKAQVGNMQRTLLEGMVPKTLSDLRAELEEKERPEQELAKLSRRRRQNSGRHGRREGGM